MTDIQTVVGGLRQCLDPSGLCKGCPYLEAVRGGEMPNTIEECGILKAALAVLEKSVESKKED